LLNQQLLLLANYSPQLHAGYRLCCLLCLLAVPLAARAVLLLRHFQHLYGCRGSN
jgi:hypothetical protein